MEIVITSVLHFLLTLVNKNYFTLTHVHFISLNQDELMTITFARRKSNLRCFEIAFMLKM